MHNGNIPRQPYFPAEISRADCSAWRWYPATCSVSRCGPSHKTSSPRSGELCSIDREASSVSSLKQFSVPFGEQQLVSENLLTPIEDRLPRDLAQNRACSSPPRAEPFALKRRFPRNLIIGSKAQVVKCEKVWASKRSQTLLRTVTLLCRIESYGRSTSMPL